MQFLFNELKPKGKYHHWGGYDTGCRMWSTGGIKRDRPGWRVVGTAPARELCHMCREATLPVHIDRERMERALAGPFWTVPPGLSREELHQFIQDCADGKIEPDRPAEPPEQSY
jgi:hypothetical protein